MIDQLFAYRATCKRRSPMARRTKPRRGRLAPWRLSRFSAPCRGRLNWRWEAGTATNQVASDLAKAASDPAVAGIILYVASGGGTVTGTDDWRGRFERRAPSSQSPHSSTTSASAAYWVASQAGRLFIAPTAAVGGIGTYGVVTDMSGLANAIGFKVHVVPRWSLQRHGDPRHGDHGGTTGGNQRVVDGSTLTSWPAWRAAGE